MTSGNAVWHIGLLTQIRELEKVGKNVNIAINNLHWENNVNHVNRLNGF